MIRIGLWFDENKAIAPSVGAIRPGGPLRAILEISNRSYMITVEVNSRRLVREISLIVDDNGGGKSGW